MPVLTRYFMVELLKFQMLSVLMLSAIFGIFAFIEQLKSVGSGQYRMLDAIWYIGMTVPQRCVELAPFIALLGALFAIGHLTRRGEIISMLASGRSFANIMGNILIGILPFIIAIMVSAEWLAPSLAQRAELQKTTRVAGVGMLVQNQGFWVRRDQGILNVRAFSPDSSPQNVSLYELNENNRLARQLKAKSAKLAADGTWHLQDVTQRRLHADKAEFTRIEEQRWKPFVQNIRTELYELPTASLSLSQLLEKRALTVAEDLSGRHFSVLFWQRMLLPCTIIGMTFLAAAFTLTNPRQGQLTKQMMICAGLGIFCSFLAQIITNISLFQEIHPIVTAILPGIVLIILAGIQYHRSDIIT